MSGVRFSLDSFSFTSTKLSIKIVLSLLSLSFYINVSIAICFIKRNPFFTHSAKSIILVGYGVCYLSKLSSESFRISSLSFA